MNRLERRVAELEDARDNLLGMIVLLTCTPAMTPPIGLAKEELMAWLKERCAATSGRAAGVYNALDHHLEQHNGHRRHGRD